MLGGMIQPVQCADGSVGDGYDGALQLEAEANALGGGAGRTHDCRQERQRKQPGAMMKYCAAPRCGAHCLLEPPFLCEAPAPESLGVSLSLWDSLLLGGLDEERRSRPGAAAPLLQAPLPAKPSSVADFFTACI